MRQLFAAVVLSAALPVIAAHPEPIAMPAGHVHEVCKAMKQGEQWAYSFTGEPALEFNVHYHVGDEVIYPVGPLHAGKQAGIVTAELDQTYCLMWRNDSAQAASLLVHSP